MVPDFALSLSFEGIALLRHVNGRWACIDEVALDVPDLDGAVNALRDRALALDPEGEKVVLVIPNEQIRYLDAPDPGDDAAAREAAVRRALEGATPYEVKDLVFDHVADRGRLRIAAVARETLDEAEAFAATHGFAGVSHAAIAPDGAFRGAVHFGKVKGWKGRTRRLPAAMVIAEADEAALTPKAVAAPEPDRQAALDFAAEETVATPPQWDEPEPVAESAPVDEPKPEPVAPQEAEPVAEGQPDPAPKVEPTPEPAVAADKTPDPVPVPAPTADAAEEEQAPVAPAAALTPGDPDAGAGLYFSTIRAALAEEERIAPPLQAPRAEHKPRFTPMAADAATAEPAPAAQSPQAPAQAPVEKPQADAAPEAGATPKPDAAPKADAPLTARERAIALASRVPGAAEDTDSTAEPTLPKPQPPIKPAGVTEGTLEAGEAAARKPGAAAAAMRFLSSRRKGKATEADPRTRRVPNLGFGKAGPAQDEAAPVLSAKPFPKAPDPQVAAGPTLTAPPADPGIPVTAKAPVAAPAAQTTGAPTTGALAGVAARRVVDAPQKAPPAPPMPAGMGRAVTAQTEAERMTIFGARGQEIGGKPRFLGLMLTATLLLFLAGVAAWASVFMQDGLASLFRSEPPAEAIASLPEVSAPIRSPDAQTETALSPAPADTTVAEEEDEDVQLAALETADDVTQQPRPPLAQPVEPQLLSPEEAAATYAATGFWLRAPTPPMTPPEDSVADVYAASIDPAVMSSDAVALPEAQDIGPEYAMLDPGLPPPAGMTFDFDQRDLIRATPEGALTPDGLRIFTGRPPVIPPLRGQTRVPEAAAPEAQVDNPLSRTRPEARPDDIVEQQERATQTGLSNAELAAMRPVMRPRTEQEEAVAEEPDSPATDQAVTASLVPVTRPRNMEAIVERARQAAPPEVIQEEDAPVRTASATAIAPRTVQPSGPTGGSVARNATVSNAINLSKVSLIGIYGTPSNRRALIRLPSGSYKKVKVGDSIDGGRVAAIGESELRYTKSGRNVLLKMPRG
ncbi:hypothetical protein [Tropicibacter sp. S64]|uniref:hypothetical protein n=1 Tax=Tropicibacter sp. S64 TaxID=3415122 RepID=UPI003C7C506D